MVNYGVSRGCDTCKKRRKKCDEARPACERCTKLGIVCLGYRNGPGYVFRHVGASSEHLSTISPRQVGAGSVAHSITSLMPDDAQVERDAVVSFFDDYTVISADRAVSRGFMDGLELLIQNAGEYSDIAKAMRIVAIAGAANRIGHLTLLHKSRLMYGKLLGTFHKSLLNPRTSNTIESLMIAVLLGMYEIISDIEANGQHAAHVKGVAAILNTEGSPFKCNATSNTSPLHNPLQLNGTLKDARFSGILCAPDWNVSLLSLDYILAKLAPVLHRAEILCCDTSQASHEQLHKLREDASTISGDCREWVAKQSEEWKPRTIGTIGEDQAHAAGFINCWPGKVDTYFDLSVSYVWNTYRKSHLMVLDIMFQCLQRLGLADQPQEQVDAQRIAEDMAASIPYHLTMDAHVHLQEVRSGTRSCLPGRPVGGLLMLHPLHMATKCTVISQELRDYMRDQLIWIGKRMGIGQAALLGDTSIKLPCHYIAESHLLVWAGMLIMRE